MPRETATQRRARQSREARESQEDWARTLPMKVLQDMARARKLGVQVTVDSQEHEPWVHVSFMDDQEDCCVVKVGDAEQCTPSWAYGVTSLLDSVQARHDAAFRKEMLRKSALEKLSKEEREALGI